MYFSKYLGKFIRVELDEGKAISGLCSNVIDKSENPTNENIIVVTIMDTMDIDILESEIKKIEELY